MKVKLFDVVLHNVPPGKSPSTQLEELINGFLKNHPNLIVTATHMNTLVVPATPASLVGGETSQPSVILFATLYYQ